MYRSIFRPLLGVFSLGLLTAFASASVAPQGIVGPFQKGLRWVHSASLTAPWIPTTVSFAAGGELVWVGTEGANRQLLLLDGSQGGVVQPAYIDSSVGTASNVVDVVSRQSAGRLFSLVQYPEPDLFHRRTVVIRHDALQLGAGAPFLADWTHPMSFVANGPARLDADESGAVVGVAALSDSSSLIRVQLLDGLTGAVLMTRDLTDTNLEDFSMSGDGSVVAVGLGQRLIVMDNFGATLHDEILGAEAHALELNQNGTRMVLGMVGELRVYDFDGVQYQLATSHQGATDELPQHVAMSDSGATYAAAWWRFRNPDNLRYEIYDGPLHTLVNQIDQPGQFGGFQSGPTGIEMTADGRRTVFASWGHGNGQPEVVLLERGLAQPVLEIDLPGSALGVDLDDTGQRVVVVTKNLHANQVGSTGEIRLYDTGERHLEQTAPARLGGSLKAVSKEAGASFAFFLVGTRAAVPSPIVGAIGELMIDRTLRMRVVTQQADAQGMAQLNFPLPSHPGFAGTELSVQVANRVGGVLVLSETVLDPLFY